MIYSLFTRILATAVYKTILQHSDKTMLAEIPIITLKENILHIDLCLRIKKSSLLW